MLAQQQHESPNIAAPEDRGPFARGGALIQRIDVVHEYRGFGRAERLDVHEVAQRELEVMHAVDERQVDR